MDPADEFYTPYSYVGNIPISYVDPDGNDAELAINWLTFLAPTGFGFYTNVKVGFSNKFALRAKSFVASYNVDDNVIEHLNSYITKWKTIAPKVSQYLDDNTISIYFMKGGETAHGKKILGAVNGLGGKKIVLEFVADFTTKSFENTFLHELVHSMGKHEFGAHAATVAAGLLDIAKTLKNMDEDIDYRNYVKRGMPESFNKYFNEEVKLINELDFIEAFEKYGQEIIGQKENIVNEN